MHSAKPRAALLFQCRIAHTGHLQPPFICICTCLSWLKEIPLNGLFGKRSLQISPGDSPEETLTVPLQDIFEIHGVGDPLAGYERLCEPPDADVHGPGSGLRSQAGEVDWLLREDVALPALALICGEPETGV